MKKKLFLLIVIIFSTNLFSQTAKYPYPIIFLHGLVSSDNTWAQAIIALGGSAKVFDVCLDHDGNRSTASLTNDISILGWRDGTNTPSPNRLYVLNYDNTRFQASGHSAHTLSNQPSIYKQGIALKEMIRAVLTIENASKVILIGHSMGGLEIREYLQRGFDGTTSGRGSNWVDQSSAFGHSVARVVTLGTPHLGCNHTGGILAFLLSGIDESSEACRDLRYSPTTPTAPYLFGGNESAYAWNPQPYNRDVNCNGSQTDLITGLNSGTTFNQALPLPTNIWYTWITSNYSGNNEDGLVELPRQWIYSGTTIAPQSADTLLLNVHHINEPNNVHAIIRGMDEPSDPNYAYKLPEDQLTKGYITRGMNWSSRDVDAFSYKASLSGSLRITFTNSNSGVDSLYVYDGTTILSRKSVQSGTQFFDVNNAARDKNYLIILKGIATGTSWQNPYSISCKTIIGEDVSENEIPLSFQLHQNYPNPFNPETVISYQLPFSGIVTLKVFDILGREAVELVNKEKTAGRYDVKFNGSKLPSGIYIYRLTGNNIIISKKMALIK